MSQYGQQTQLHRACLVAFAALLVLAPSAAAQHPAIYLMDVNGSLINPVRGDNADAPFSTKRTCGMCHDYDQITQGFHFQMGWDVVSDDYGVAEGRPWSLSNGFLGRWYPYAFRQLAKKEKAIHFVKTDDLLKSGLYKDRLHFNNKSKEEIGRRFAKVMHKALAQ